MTSFEELRDRALDLAQAGVAKAKELTDIAKLNINNTAEEEAIKKAYVELGKLYYAERGMAPEGAYVTLCEKITAAKTRMEENKSKINDIRKDDCAPEPCRCDCTCCDTDVAPEEVIVVEETKVPDEAPVAPVVPDEIVVPVSEDENKDA